MIFGRADTEVSARLFLCLETEMAKHEHDENGRITETTTETKTTVITWGHQHCSCGEKVASYKVSEVQKNPPIGGTER